MSQSKKETISVAEVKQAIAGFVALGYPLERFFVAARRYTNTPFNPTEEAAAYRDNRQYVPSDPIQRFTAWFQKTDGKKRLSAVERLIGAPEPRRSLEMEVVEGLAAA